MLEEAMLTVLCLLLLAGQADPSVTYSQLSLHTEPGHLDRWTIKDTGCPCPGLSSSSNLSCPCCAPGGCPCPEAGARCVQCGLQKAACLNGKEVRLTAIKGSKYEYEFIYSGGLVFIFMVETLNKVGINDSFII